MYNYSGYNYSGHNHYKLIIVAVISVATLALMALDRTSITPPTPLGQGIPQNLPAQPAPDVIFTRLGGGSVALHSLSGHTVLLHFWASWCVPCRAEFSSLLEHTAKSDNTVLLAVSGDAKPQDAERFIAPYKRKFQSLFDSGRVIIAQDPQHTLIEGTFQTFQYPETIVIAPDLTLRQKIVGRIKE